ncbi:MAG: hypothetical protein HRT68_14985 [Flavobacteriaceae bacterium]|nr:hypothetical protein [Flavobacteriaceae bacterium]
MKLILNEHHEILKELIGQTIKFGLIPNLYLSSCETYPDEIFYNQTYGHFYSSTLINLRFENHDSSKSWVTFSPGPDEDIKDWAPFWAEKVVSADFNGVNKDTRVFEKELAKKLVTGSNQIELENNFLDTHIDGLGMTRCNLWDNNDPIKKIEILDFSPYAGCIITHESGMEWCMYAEYDFLFWINFSNTMPDNFRQSSYSKITIE